MKRPVYLEWYSVIWRRSQWSIVLRLGSAAARLMGSRMRFPPGAWMYVAFACCVLSVAFSA
jgi:hypothetical protein